MTCLFIEWNTTESIERVALCDPQHIILYILH